MTDTDSFHSTDSLHHSLNTVEASSVDTALARMVRLRLAITHVTPEPGRSMTGGDLEEHWLTLVYDPTGDETVDHLERDRLRALLRRWLDAQRVRQYVSVRNETVTATPRTGARGTLQLREPLQGEGDPRQRWWRHFERVSPEAHTLGRELAHDGVLELNVGYLHATAIVAAHDGGRYVTVLRWPGGMPKVPHTVAPACSCPVRRRWCKHAIAATYHLIERSWRQGVAEGDVAYDNDPVPGGGDGTQQMEKPPESARKR